MGVRDIEKEIEWELLATPRSIRDITRRAELPAGTRLIEISRSANYELEGVYSGDWTVGEHTSVDQVPAGTAVHGMQIEGVDTHHDHIALHGVYPRELTRSYPTASGERRSFRGTLGVGSVHVSRGHDTTAVSLTEWYLNGPRETTAFFRATERTTDLNFVRTRDADEVAITAVASRPSHSESTSVDHAVVDTGKYKFVVAQVPPGFGPEWSRSLSVEYRADLGGIPDEVTREAISEALGFVLGRQLLLVGWTERDEHGDWTAFEARSPWGNGVADLCGTYSTPPVQIFDRQFEAVASALIPVYLERRERLGLKGAIWNYWLARRAPIGPNLVFIAAAMESLMHGWFASARSSSAGLNMPKEEFDKLIADEVNSLGQKLDGHPRAARILSRIRGSYTMGVNERFSTFFEEIRLPIGSVELVAIRERNAPAHGKGVAPDERTLADQLNTTERMHEVQAHYRAYEVLFHRVLLRLLDFEGEYVDYASIGHPVRALGAAAGG